MRRLLAGNFFRLRLNAFCNAPGPLIGSHCRRYQSPEARRRDNLFREDNLNADCKWWNGGGEGLNITIKPSFAAHIVIVVIGTMFNNTMLISRKKKRYFFTRFARPFTIYVSPAPQICNFPTFFLLLFSAKLMRICAKTVMEYFIKTCGGGGLVKRLSRPPKNTINKFFLIFFFANI